MKLTMNDDDSMTIEWDENDPIESQFNDYTEEQWIKAIEEMLAREWESTPEEDLMPEFDDPLA